MAAQRPVAEVVAWHSPLGPYGMVALALAAAVLSVFPVLASHHLPLLDAPAHEARLWLRCAIC